MHGERPLRDKLHDLHHLLRAYHEWLEQSQTQDADQLLDLATARVGDFAFRISGLWLDGFAEMTPQEMDLLCAVLPFCRNSTLAFCLDPQASDSKSWLSLWSTVRRTYGDCIQRIKALPNCEVSTEELARDPAHSRFRGNPTLAELEANWTAPAARAGHFQSPALRLAVCAHPEAEATHAAREILRHVRADGRFRDCAVILRTLDHHHTALRRVFTRYGIPFFLDRREPVAHHPLAELTRFALRTLAYGWQPNDLLARSSPASPTTATPTLTGWKTMPSPTAGAARNGSNHSPSQNPSSTFSAPSNSAPASPRHSESSRTN